MILCTTKCIWFLPQERSWLDGFMKSGFVDSFRHFNSDPHQYSWWSYRAGARARIADYNLVSDSLQHKLKGPWFCQMQCIRIIVQFCRIRIILIQKQQDHKHLLNMIKSFSYGNGAIYFMCIQENIQWFRKQIHWFKKENRSLADDNSALVKLKPIKLDRDGLKMDVSNATAALAKAKQVCSSSGSIKATKFL
jgi:hypothetical protein